MATTSASIHAAYTVARNVYEGNQLPGLGADVLHQQHGFNRNSARDLISAYKHLVRGEVFHRGLSAADMDYYLFRIRLDSGAITLRLALQALWKHIDYYERLRSVTLHRLRGIASKHDSLAAPPASTDLLEANFQEAVRKSMAASGAERSARLKEAPRKPKRLPIATQAFERNPDVVAQVLIDAKGICARCQRRAPFKRRSDGSPYLEVHHKVQLSLGGDDTVENAEALCPNCHRERHYGAEAT